MRYVLKQDALAWGDDFDIHGEAGAKLYSVDGRGIAFINRLSLKDLAKNELASIRQVLFSWGSQYDLYLGDKLLARVSQETLSRAKYRFHIEVPGPSNLDAVGDFYNHSYDFFRSQRVVAHVSRLDSGSGCSVEVSAGEDDVLILGSAIAIDLVSHEGSNEGKMYK